jgi:hypothetical protein
VPLVQNWLPSRLQALRKLLVVYASASAVLVSTTPSRPMRAITRFTVAAALPVTDAAPSAAS